VRECRESYNNYWIDELASSRHNNFCDGLVIKLSVCRFIWISLSSFLHAMIYTKSDLLLSSFLCIHTVLIAVYLPCCSVWYATLVEEEARCGDGGVVMERDGVVCIGWMELWSCSAFYTVLGCRKVHHCNLIHFYFCSCSITIDRATVEVQIFGQVAFVNIHPRAKISLNASSNSKI